MIKGVFSLAVEGVINIFLSLVFIGLSFWALQSFRLELFLKNPRGAQAKVLQIFLAIAIGHLVSSFLTSYFGWTVLLKQFFAA